jgi:hypothetical protein
MQKDKLIYWITTGLVSALVLFSAFSYFTNPAMAEGFRHLGFPDYFRIELGVAKFLAIAVILLPMAPARFKEWAYAGLGIVFISAAIAHGVVDGPDKSVVALVALAILGVSYVYYHKLRGE